MDGNRAISPRSRFRWALFALLTMLALVLPGQGGQQGQAADTGATGPIAAGIFAGPCDDLAAEPEIDLTDLTALAAGTVASSITTLTTDAGALDEDVRAIVLRQAETEIACGALSGGQLSDQTVVISLRGRDADEPRGAAFVQRVAEARLQVLVMLDPQWSVAPPANTAGNPTVQPTPITINADFSLVGTAAATQPAAVAAPAVAVAGACEAEAATGQAVASVSSATGSITAPAGEVSTAVVSAAVPGTLDAVTGTAGVLVITPGDGWTEGPVCGPLTPIGDADRLIVPLRTVADGGFVGACFIESDASGGSVLVHAFLSPVLAQAEQPAVPPASEGDDDDENDDEDDDGNGKDGKDGKDKKDDDDDDD